MAEEMKCPICGKPTSSWYGKYRNDKLCKQHAIEKKDGLIQFCEKCNTWHKINMPCACSSKIEPNLEKQNNDINTENDTCVICGNKSFGKPQCKNCYHETKNYIDSLDKNSSVRKLRDYYYNLKDRIVIIKSLEETKKQCNKLIAIALMDNDINEDSSLIARVYNDVKNLINSKYKTPINEKYIEEQTEKDKKKTKINTSQDGHNLESDMEVRIDDILYNSFILHSYGNNIQEITECRKKCDWFIPIANGKGIYIEYFGKDTEDYLKSRKEKEELYRKYNIPYIAIEKDDPKQDTQTFKSNLIRDLTNLAIKQYGFMPEWKK